MKSKNDNLIEFDLDESLSAFKDSLQVHYGAYFCSSTRNLSKSAQIYECIGDVGLPHPGLSPV